MPYFRDVRQFPYAPESVFTLVARVEEYPHFLPWCQEVKIRERQDNRILADLTAGMSFVSETYTSLILLAPFTKIEVSQHEGPFQYLSNTWLFRALDKGTEVMFEIDFQFKSSFLGKTMEVFFMQAVSQMITAFETQLKRNHSKEGIPQAPFQEGNCEHEKSKVCTSGK